MILKKENSGVIICKDLKACVSFSDRMLGLLSFRNPRNLLFFTRFGIHTFFLKEPIDVLVLNAGFQVVFLKSGLKPYRFFFWDPGYKTVLELLPGSINKFGIRKGDTLTLR